MKKLGQAKRFAEDAYTAEDDFWKIFTWFGEKGRIAKNMDNAGMVRGKKYKDIDGNEFTYNDNWIEGEAANIVKNQVPNYAFVSDFVKSLRQLPLGNFIAFPLEIIRTGHNIFKQSLDEIYSGIPEIRSLGMKRLFSFGATVGGVPYGLVEMYKSKTGATDEEMDALRKFVPEWSQNSTLLPVGRDENGYLKYIDFSYSNAYDTLIRPFNAIVNELSTTSIALILNLRLKSASVRSIKSSISVVKSSRAKKLAIAVFKFA
jgi:hypothetical protein